MTEKLDRFECLNYLADRIDDELVLSWGITTQEWFALTSGRPGNLSHSGMGSTVPFAIGLAKALPDRKVIAFAGDGDLLMQLGGLTSLGRENPENLVVLVNDNESYETLAESYPTMTAGTTDFEGFADAAGVEYTATVRSFDAYTDEVDQALERSDCARFIVMKTEQQPVQTEGSSRFDRQVDKYRFIRHVEETEDVQIFPPIHEK